MIKWPKAALYDVGADPSMTKPLDEPLQPWLNKAKGAFPEYASGTGLTVPNEAIEQLKILGYVE